MPAIIDAAPTIPATNMQHRTRSAPLCAWPYAALVLLGLALYLPLRGATLYHEDAVGFALAIHQFDLAKHQPQVPGFPLYILLLRLVQFATGLSDEATIVLVSLLAVSLAAPLFYGLARRYIGHWPAFGLAVVLLTNPLAWFNADISMSYSLNLLLSVAVAACCERLCAGVAAYRWLTPIAWGVAAGVREDVAVLLLPLVIYAYLPTLRRSPRAVLLPAALGLLATAAWLVPLMGVSGGPRAYLGMVHGRAAGDGIVPPLLAGHPLGSLVLAGQNIAVIGCYLLFAALGLLPLQLLRLRRAPVAVNRRWALFLLVWLLPGLAIDAASVVGHAGYALPYLPPLLLLLWPPRPRLPRRSAVAPALLALGVALQCAYFLFIPQYEGPLPASWVQGTLLASTALEPAHSRIARADALTTDLSREIKAHYPAEQTLLIVPVGDERPRDVPLRHMYGQGRYYLPAYQQRVLYLVPIAGFDKLGYGDHAVATVFGDTFQIKGGTTVDVPVSTRWLVWFCDVDQQFYPFNPAWRRATIAPGVDLVAAPVGTGRVNLRWGPFAFRRG